MATKQTSSTVQVSPSASGMQLSSEEQMDCPSPHASTMEKSIPSSPTPSLSGHTSSSSAAGVNTTEGNIVSSQNAVIRDLDMELPEPEPLQSGPLRFAGSSASQTKLPHPTIDDQLNALSDQNREIVIRLKTRWEKQNPDFPFSDKMYLQFARFTSRSSSQRNLFWWRGNNSKRKSYRNRNGKYQNNNKVHADSGTDLTMKNDLRIIFREADAWKAMTSFDHRYLSLTAEALDMQLRSKTLFPVPGLTAPYEYSGYPCHIPMFYMRPSRYFPRSTPIQDVIDNLAYVMQTMTSTNVDAQLHGIGFLANMAGWTCDNFSVQYCAAFMSMLQGNVIPVRVQVFLIVDPPSWFPVIWKIMKPMLSPTFRRKVHMISQSELSDYLSPGYEQYLPDEMDQGTVKTTDLVRDFIEYRQHVEEQDAILEANSMQTHSLVPSTISTPSED